MKRRAKKNSKVIPFLEDTEGISCSEQETVAEDLHDTGVVRDCMDEEFDEEGVIDRVRLF